MQKDTIIFEAKFKNVETDKELSYYIAIVDDGSNEWEQALSTAKRYENDSILLIKLEYLGLVLNA